MKIIFLIMIGFGLIKAEFTKIGNIVKDSATKLEWQANAEALTMEWVDAVSYCEDLNMEGTNDWRLPNINELKSIVDRSKVNPAIVTGFENSYSNYYWSSTTYESYKSYAWIVSFGAGDVDYRRKILGSYVRCVRGGQ